MKTILAVMALLLAGAAKADTINIDSGHVELVVATGDTIVNVSGGEVGGFLGCGVYGDIYGRDQTTINVTGGFITSIRAKGNCTVNISGGWFDGFGIGPFGVRAYGNSTVNISGGILAAHYTGVDGGLYARDTSVSTISGGVVDLLRACEDSIVTINARDFILGDGLSLDGDRVLGTGVLSGQWFDGTEWSTTILQNQSGAAILAVPEPATLALLALGGLALLRRRH